MAKPHWHSWMAAQSDALTRAANQVSATAQSLSQAASEQAASVEETTSQIDVMSASITQNSDNAKVTDGMATKASKGATDGGTAVSQTVTAMKQIAAKIGIVDDIAYPTVMHYVFDQWVVREMRNSIRFEHYAEDIVCHCQSRQGNPPNFHSSQK
jgi:hypothetical protein